MAGENQVGGERVERAGTRKANANLSQSQDRSPIPPARKQLAQRQ